MIKLFDYQERVMELSAPVIILNWARGLGKTWTIANYIKEKKPRKVILANRGLIQLKDRFEEIMKLDKEFKESIQSYEVNQNDIAIKYVDGSQTNITLMKNFEPRVLTMMQNRDVDLLVYDDQLPDKKVTKLNVKTLSTISMNDFDESLRDKYDNNVVISRHDYYIGLDNDLIKHSFIDGIKKQYRDMYFREFAILDNPSDSVLSFEEFRIQAFQKLQKQFMNTPNRNDTVLTRKNLLDMIEQLYRMK